MQQNLPNLPSTGFIRSKQLVPGIIPISRATLWNWVRDGKFPAPRKMVGVTAWKCEDVHAWIGAQK
jgi:predicted DNA-binding transcriptional regulator AlpA